MASKTFKKVKIKWNEKELEGILLPYEDSNVYMLKLENGYNIGIKKDEVESFEELGEIKIDYEESSSNNEGEISVIACGGTISSRVDYKTGAVIPSMNFSVFEGLKEKVKAIELFKVFSEEFTTEHWKELAKSVYSELKDGNPVIVLHGTDTMHYSASAVAFAIQQLNNPVVFTGSQRSVDRPSSDAKQNVLNSILTAKQNFGEVVIVMHSSSSDDFAYVHRGVKARKMHTSRRDAFKSINIKPLAKANYERKLFEKLEENYPLRNRTKLGSLQNDFNDNVGILYYYPGLKPEFVSKFSEFDGIVVVGTGLGHVSAGASKDNRTKPILNELKQLIESDVKVVMAPQTINGRINMNVYSTGRRLLEIGIIGNYADMVPETAFVKLSWVLAREKRYKKVKEIMESNIVGEITERSEYLKEY